MLDTYLARTVKNYQTNKYALQQLVQMDSSLLNSNAFQYIYFDPSSANWLRALSGFYEFGNLL